MKKEFAHHYSDESGDNYISRLLRDSKLNHRARALIQDKFYPQQSQIELLWKDCIFIFDANALTHLYQMPKDLQTRYLDVLQRFSERIWIPHHAAAEYHRHLEQSFSDSCPSITKLHDFRAKIRKEALAFSNEYQEWHWLKELFSSLEENAEKLIETAIGERNRRIQKFESLKNSVAVLFENKVGPAFSETELEEVNVEAQHRLVDNRPPACEVDAQKKENKFGDVIIWKQILNHAVETQKSFIFITDDRKQNWHFLDESGLVGPRPELIAEAKRVANVLMWSYSSTGFIKWAQTELDLPKKERIDTVIKKSEEEYKNNRAHLVPISVGGHFDDMRKLIGLPAELNSAIGIASLANEAFHSNPTQLLMEYDYMRKSLAAFQKGQMDTMTALNDLQKNDAEIKRLIEDAQNPFK